MLIAGTNISFPSVQLLSPDITLTGGNTLFTVNTAGLYRVSYHVNTVAAVLLGTRLVVNGGVLVQSRIPPALSLSQFYNEVELDLTAGSTITATDVCSIDCRNRNATRGQPGSIYDDNQVELKSINCHVNFYVPSFRK